MKKTTRCITLIALIGMTTGGYAASIIPLAADAVNSTPSAFGGSIGVTTTDGFAYDPENPLSTSPNRTWNATRGFHGNEANSADVTLIYDATHTIALPDEVVVFDIWGRHDTDPRNRWQGRDDNFDVELFDSSGGSLGTVTGLAIADGPAIQHARASFGSLPVGTTIGQVVVTGHDSENTGNAGDTNNFTVMEVRLAAIPEPSSVLLALTGLGFGLRRRR